MNRLDLDLVSEEFYNLLINECINQSKPKKGTIFINEIEITYAVEQ